jgi:O-antigen biosynthesis protein
MKKLKELYQNHSEKVSQKWEIYFNQYEEKFSEYKNFSVKILEIGIENGGSLEIYSKYFSNAELILGCDKNRNCKNLQYDNQNIKIIIGDANEEKTKNEVIKHSKFDIIIDDGSHGSPDIVGTFCNYFNYLKDDGIFIIEDLHCSYWEKWGGGIFYPISSINFFKKLVDILNYEHWGIDKKKSWLLRGFSFNYKLDFEKLALDQIHSIEFVNSLCFIKKKPSVKNKLGSRIVAGKNAQIYPDVIKLGEKPLSDLNESKNPWSNKDLFPEEEASLCKQKVEQQEKQILSLKKEIESLKKK